MTTTLMVQMVVAVVEVQTPADLVVQPINLHKTLVSQISHSLDLLVVLVEVITLIQEVAEAVVELAVLAELLLRLDRVYTTEHANRALRQLIGSIYPADALGAQPSFLDFLPWDVLERVFDKLDAKSLCCAAQCSKDFLELSAGGPWMSH